MLFLYKINYDMRSFGSDNNSGITNKLIIH